MAKNNYLVNGMVVSAEEFEAIMNPDPEATPACEISFERAVELGLAEFVECLSNDWNDRF